MFLSPLFPPLCSPRRSLGPWFSLYRQRICRQDWPSSVDASKIGSQRKSCIPENLPVTAGSLRQNGLECVYIIFESRTTTYQQQKNISTSHTACPSVSFHPPAHLTLVVHQLPGLLQGLQPFQARRHHVRQAKRPQVHRAFALANDRRIFSGARCAAAHTVEVVVMCFQVEFPALE